MNHRETPEDRMAGELLDRYEHVAAQRGSPLWLEVRTSAGAAIETAEVRGPQGLLGRFVRPGWEAAGLVATGRFRLLDEAREPPATLVPALAGGLRMACVVSRRAGTGWRMRLPDGTFFPDAPEEGMCLDILRRAVGLATPPPPPSLAEFQIVMWAQEVISLSANRGRRLRWGEVLRAHPGLLDEDLAGDDGMVEARVVELADCGDWETFRRYAAAERAGPMAPDPELVRWMDSGLFSRWTMQALPPLDALVATAHRHLDGDATRRFRHLVHALGVPETGLRRPA